MATRERPAGPTATTELIGPPAPAPDEPPPGRELWPWLLVLLVLVIAGLAAVWYATRDTTSASGPVTVQTTVAAKPKPIRQHTTTAPTTTAQPQTVVVPDLIGQSEDEAVRTLETQGLTPDVQEVPSAEADGTVVSQHPAGGTTVQSDAGVLINVGHKVEQPKPEPKTKPANRENSQGEQQDKKKTAVAPRAAPPSAAAVPNVVGEDGDTAKADLRSAGFHVDKTDQDTTDPSQDGMVVDQSPAGGASAQTGSRVTIYIGRYSDNGDNATG